jgi:hypothetical protein
MVFLWRLKMPIEKLTMTPIIMIIPIITGIIITIIQTNYLKICSNLWQSSSDKND